MVRRRRKTTRTDPLVPYRTLFLSRHENFALFPRPARQPMTATQADPSLQALMLPFADGTLAWPRDGALFLRARDGWPLHERPLPGLVCEQVFRPDAQALERSGFDVREPDESKYPLVLVLPPRQRDEARADRKSTRLNSSH